MLLTNRDSASAAEGFALALRVLPHVTVVGDLTEGALSAQFPDRMPNGWTLWVSFHVLTDQNGVNWDGVGIPPDLRVANTSADLLGGVDRPLEFAQQPPDADPRAVFVDALHRQVARRKRGRIEHLGEELFAAGVAVQHKEERVTLAFVVSLWQVDGVFHTHAHDDHTADLESLLMLLHRRMTWTDADGKPISPKPSARKSTKVPKCPAFDSRASCQMMKPM